MKPLVAMSAWIAAMAVATATLADPSGPATSGLRLVIIGQGALGSPDFSVTGINIVHGSGPGGTHFESSVEGQQWSCDNPECTSRSTSYEDLGDVVQTVRACGQGSDCSFSSDVAIVDP